MDARAMRDRFEEAGFVCVDKAVPEALAAQLRQRVLDDAGPAPRGKRLGDYSDAQFVGLFSSDRLRRALDAVLGRDRWAEPSALEDVRVKAPGPDFAPWWHIDVFEQAPETKADDPLTWRASLSAGGVGALATVLLSDVGEDQAPTALRRGSHRVVAERLSDAPSEGLPLGELLQQGIAGDTADAPCTLTWGTAGSVYLCHPLLVHTALPNRGMQSIVTALHPVRLRA